MRHTFNMNNFRILFSALGIFLATTVHCQEGKTIIEGNTVTICRDGHMFSVLQPKGWQCDTSAAVRFVGGEVSLQLDKKEADQEFVIVLQTFDNETENAKYLLREYIKTYKETRKEYQGKPFISSHKIYDCFSSMMFMKNSFHNYFVFLAPNKKIIHGVFLEMTFNKRVASMQELNIFNKIVSSVIIKY